jgi:hypothetical protein
LILLVFFMRTVFVFCMTAVLELDLTLG